MVDDVKEVVEVKKPLDLASVLGGMMSAENPTGTDAVLQLSSKDVENLPMRTWLKEPHKFSRAQLYADYEESRGFSGVANYIRSACGWQYLHLCSKDGRLIELSFETLGKILALENQALVAGGGSPEMQKKQSLLGRLRGR